MESKIWDLINPSDSITFMTENFKLAAAAVLILGEGRYGADLVGTDITVPMFLFATEEIINKWIGENFKTDIKGLFKSTEKLALAKVFDSFAIVPISQRSKYEAIVSRLEGEELKSFKEDYHDKERSSMNDICGRAWEKAEYLRKTAGEPWYKEQIMNPIRYDKP